MTSARRQLQLQAQMQRGMCVSANAYNYYCVNVNTQTRLGSTNVRDSIYVVLQVPTINLPAIAFTFVYNACRSHCTLHTL